ncbi:MAG TPA: hypothetical protein PLP07_02055 [Pyrinomonadaceae bacterium]|nr:hypothetical protein [Chloracidobacterium sp.]MBP9934740.1 hypothetical protein [Pyrinomonadaceae bacterium]MBK9767524.1 hypothetical protein [Chloracidobacterium sp.]HQX54683.1 hypothetical protein [Pyrinomonadaceae bacterium]HQY66371.1 hypothetical protein [Pyrinomonadaceae bacterium]
MDRSNTILGALGTEWIPTIYEEKIRSQRTRSYSLEVSERENIAEIQYTLLGIELKVGKRRFSCPDLAMARYLRVFARLGCTSFAVPYDITKISAAADELETSWQKMLLLVDAESDDRSEVARKRLRRTILGLVRKGIADIGAGALMPEFNRQTRQRS